ncbi:MAG: DNA repair protein RadC [Opitutales bacterium]|nr:DNA repair protein RadC [Opitutales bacterium]
MNYEVAPRIEEMATHERPQERLESLGAKALSDAELLALVLRSGTPDIDVLSLSRNLVDDAGSLARLLTRSRDDFLNYAGVGRVKAVQLAAILEIARRVSAEQAAELPTVDTPDSVWRVLRSRVMHLEVEKFYVLLLNRKNRLLRIEEVTSGTATASLVHPREVFRAAVSAGAVAMICAHNHPSGDPLPSAQDIRITRQLREASRVMQIELVDHVILGESQHAIAGLRYYSFSENGML